MAHAEHAIACPCGSRCMRADRAVPLVLYLVCNSVLHKYPQLSSGIAGLAAMVELLSEPLYILAQLRLKLQLRVSAEACATLARGVATLALLKLSALDVGIALSIAQVRSGCHVSGHLILLDGDLTLLHAQLSRAVHAVPTRIQRRTSFLKVLHDEDLGCDRIASRAVYICSSHPDGLYWRHG